MPVDQIASGDIMECIVFGLADGQSVLNVFHWRAVPGEGSGLVQIHDVAIGLRDSWRESVLPKLNETYLVAQYQVSRISGKEQVENAPPNTFKLTYDLRSTIPGAVLIDKGGDVGDPLPTFNAIGMLKRSTTVGRSGRGAIRFAPITETQIDGNVVDAVFGEAFRAAVQASLVPFAEITAGDEVAIGMTIFRKKEYLKSPIPNEPPELYFADVVALELRPFASSQTTRKRKRSTGQ